MQELPGVRSRYRGRRPRHRPREHRGPLRRDRVRGGQPRRAELIDWVEHHGQERIRRGLGHLDQADLDHRHAPHRRVRLRLRAQERPPQGHGRAQGEHHEVHRRPLPPRRPRGGGGEHRHRVRGPDRRQHVHAARAEARGVRRARAARTSTATSSPTSAPAWSAASASRPAATSATHAAVFEPTHGSAPKYAGQNKVNPMAHDPLRRADAPPPRRARRRRPARGARSPT